MNPNASREALAFLVSALCPCTPAERASLTVDALTEAINGCHLGSWFVERHDDSISVQLLPEAIWTAFAEPILDYELTDVRAHAVVWAVVNGREVEDALAAAFLVAPTLGEADDLLRGIDADRGVVDTEAA